MAIRIITTAVIDCDEPGCEETFYDCVALTPEEASRFAEYHDWFEMELSQGPSKWFCPKCVARQDKEVIEWAKQQAP